MRIQSWFAGDDRQRWWDLFEFGRFEEGLRFSGVLPWWTAETLDVRFFRPVAAATHVLDQWLWPSSPASMHVHSLLWATALGLSVLWVYRDMFERRAAALASLVYCASSIHRWPVMWISNRNALLAATFGVLAFGVYRHGRRHASHWVWGAPLLLGVCLLSAEAGVSVMAFVIAFELTEGRDVPRKRWLPLLAMFGVVVAWRLAYDAAGFGATSSGAYLDPLRAPGAFISQAPARLGWLLLELLTPLSLVRSVGLAVGAQWVLGAVLGTGTLVGLAVGVHTRTVRMLLLGAGLALPPLLTSMPQARLLTFVWFGVAPALGVALVRAAAWKGPARSVSALVGIGPLIISPAVVLGAADWLDARSASAVETPGLAIAPDRRVRGRSLILIHAPSYDRAMAVGFARATAGKPLPTFSWILSTGGAVPEVSRRGCCTLVVARQDGFVGDPLASYYRGPHVPFAVGDAVETLAFKAAVEAVDEHGAATQVAFVFPHRLGAKQLLYATWAGGDFVRVRPRELRRE